MTFSPPGSSASVLVGRDREIGVLRQHLNAAFSGQGRLVLIGGEAGIGKTALAETLCYEASAQGALILTGRAFDLAETAPFGPWIDLFAHFHPTDDLPPPPAPFAVRGTVGAVPSQAMLFNAVLDCLAALSAQRPLVILLDDAQWHDSGSLDLLRFLAREIATLPILLLVTYRVDELTRHHPLYQLLPVLVREARAERLDLPALDEAAMSLLVMTRYALPEADAERLVAYLRGRAEGNALFIGELLRSLEEGGVLALRKDGWYLGDLALSAVPPLLRQVIDGRVARLDEESQRLLTVAAVIGHEVSLDVWATVTETDEDAVLVAVEQGLEARLLVEVGEGEGVRFVHALIREAMYERLPGVRRRRIHRRVGEVLAALPTADPDAVAYHYQRADDERALPWLLKAGERAQTAYAWVTAAVRFEAALALMERSSTAGEERGWLLMRLARLLRYADVAKARAFVDAALTIAEATSGRALAAYARHQRGLLDCYCGEIERGLADVEAGAAAQHALSSQEQRAFASRSDTLTATTSDGWALVVLLRAHAGRLREARTLGETLLAGLPPGEDAASLAEGNICNGLALAAAWLGMREEASGMFRRSRHALASLGHYTLLFQVTCSELLWGVLPYRTEDIVGRRMLASEGEAMQARAGGATTALPAGWTSLPVLALEGCWHDVRRVARATRTVEGWKSTNRGVADLIEAAVLVAQGDAEGAWALVGEWLPAGEETRPGTVLVWVALAMQRLAVALALAGGNLPTGKAWLEAHDRWLAWSGAVLGRSEGDALWAAYWRAAGDAVQARQHAERALAHATDPRQPIALLAAHRLLGDLDTDASRLDDARNHIDESLALADACAAPYERTLTLLALATLQAATGDIATARTLLDDVRHICEPLGAQPTLARVDALTQRLATAHAVPMHPAGLSAREVEVLRFVAEGLSNPQVGERLFLSPRTVEQHLRSIFNKTGVPSRAAAARWASENGLV